MPDIAADAVTWVMFWSAFVLGIKPRLLSTTAILPFLHPKHTIPPKISLGRNATMFFAQSTSSADSISTTQENREGLRSKLCQELGDFIPKTNSNWTENLYQELFSSGMIDGYLDDGDEYCSGRWTRIPETPIVESALRDPICRIINSIIQQFGYSGSRFATVSPLFESTDEAEETRYPSIIVKGKGPSFYEPKASSLGFSNVAACFETKLDSEAADVWNQLARMSEYAK